MLPKWLKLYPKSTPNNSNNEKLDFLKITLAPRHQHDFHGMDNPKIMKKNITILIKIVEQVQVLIQSLGFWIDYDSFPNNSDRFMQVHGEISGLEVRVDFYFYDTRNLAF